MKKLKEFKFDVILIIDHNEINVMGKPVKSCTHHSLNGLTLKQLNNLIKENMVPDDMDIDVSIYVKGKNH